MKRNYIFIAIYAFLAAAVTGGYSEAAVLDPISGGDYYFSWYGLGPIDDIYETRAPGSAGGIVWTDLGSFWSLSVSSDSFLNVLTAWDDFVPGDMLGLIFDGLSAPWTSSFTDSSSYLWSL